MQPFGVVVALVVILDDLFRQVWRKPAVFLPDDAMCEVSGVDDVYTVDAGGIFLTDAGKDALGAGSLYANSNIRILRLERLAETFRELQVHCGIKRDLAFFFRRIDQ